MGTRLRWLGDFLGKFANDWSLNLSGLLAYNFLTAVFPLFLGVLAVAAVVLSDVQVQRLAAVIAGGLPSEVTSQDGLNLNFYQMLVTFHNVSKRTAIFSFLGFIWTGSNLFGVMDNCFAIVFRTRGRDPLRQKLMAIGMVFFFAVLAPLAVIASTVSGSFEPLARLLGDVPGLRVALSFGGYVVGVAIAFVLFFLIYLIVPNRRMHPGEVWPGALVAALLFEVANYVFPVYVGHFMVNAWFGKVLLLFGILALWFWLLALIVLLGAELTSYLRLHQRPLETDIAGLVHRAAAHGGTLPPPVAAPPLLSAPEYGEGRPTPASGGAARRPARRPAPPQRAAPSMGERHLTPPAPLPLPGKGGDATRGRSAKR